MLATAALWTFLALSSIFVWVAPGAAQTVTFTRSDITGNDVDCGQGSGRCRVCGDINAIDSSCRANPACNAYTFDNSCGFLKSAGEPRTYREGFAVFLLTEKTPSGAKTATPALTPATTTIPAAATPAAAAADPAAAAAAAPNKIAQQTTTTPSAAPIPPPSEAADPATNPTTAAAAGGGDGGCVIPAWQQCGGKGADCASEKPGYQCVDGTFSGCTCVEGYYCQRKDQFFYQCAPPNYRFPRQQGASAAKTPATIPASAAPTPAQPTVPIPAAAAPPAAAVDADDLAAIAAQRALPGFQVDEAAGGGR